MGQSVTSSLLLLVSNKIDPGGRAFGRNKDQSSSVKEGERECVEKGNNGPTVLQLSVGHSRDGK